MQGPGGASKTKRMEAPTTRSLRRLTSDVREVFGLSSSTQLLLKIDDGSQGDLLALDSDRDLQQVDWASDKLVVQPVAKSTAGRADGASSSGDFRLGFQAWISGWDLRLEIQIWMLGFWARFGFQAGIPGLGLDCRIGLQAWIQA